MATDADETIDQLHRGRVSAEVLLKGLKDAVDDASDWAANCQLAEDTVGCIWANQSDDGLKHAFAGDELPPSPWEGAHDTRIRLWNACCASTVVLRNCRSSGVSGSLRGRIWNRRAAILK